MGPFLQGILSRGICFLSFVAMDGKDDNGLKLEKVGPTFSSFKGCLNKKYFYGLLVVIQFIQGSRLTFQLASPVASDRFDSLAKTDFSLARRRHLLLYREQKILPDL